MRKRDDAVWVERREVVTRWEGSGLSMAEFCRREGIGYLAFTSWRKRFAAVDNQHASVFAELVVAPATPSAREATRSVPLEIVLGDALVRVFAGAGVPTFSSAGRPLDTSSH